MKNNIQGFVVFSIIAFAMALFPMKGEASSAWTTVGTAGFTVGGISDLSFAFNPGTSEPYVAYADAANLSKATVMKFDGTEWSIVGTAGFSAESVTQPALAFNSETNEPYVAYRDSVNGNKATVMKFNGTSWIAVGSAGFSAGSPSDITLTFNPITNEPYVAYRDGASASNATVMSFDSVGNSWDIVGTAGFSAGHPSDITLAFNPTTNEPYVAFMDAVYADKTTVMKFNGTEWSIVGTAGFSGGVVELPSFAFNPGTSEPYIVYPDITHADKATVMKFNGSDWVVVGTAGFTSDTTYYTSLAFNPATNEPYVAYIDNSTAYKASVSKFDGTSWVTVGTAGFSAGVATYLDLAFNPSTNEPYVAYKDEENGNKATVMKLPQVAVAPVASPVGAKYSSKKSVTLSSSTAGAAIYYTIDGTTPTTSSTLYTGAIVISKSKTLKAIATKSGYADSSVMSESYTIKKSSSSKKKKKKKISSKITSKAGERISPYITLITPKVGFATTKSFVIQGAASDKSGIQSMFVSVNGTKKKKSTTGSISYTAKKLTNASINVSAYDTLGNVKVAVVTITNGRVSGVRYY